VDHRVAKPGLAKLDLAKPRVAKHGFAGLAEHVAATLFFSFFPADCRICGSPLIRVSRLPVCRTRLLRFRPLPGSYSAVGGEGLRFRFDFGRRRERFDSAPGVLIRRDHRQPQRPDASSAAGASATRCLWSKRSNAGIEPRHLTGG
jgi:hypothetical protein